MMVVVMMMVISCGSIMNYCYLALMNMNIMIPVAFAFDIVAFDISNYYCHIYKMIVTVVLTLLMMMKMMFRACKTNVTCDD